MKNIPLYEVRPINNLREMLKGSVELYGDKPAFLYKKKEGDNYLPITYRQYGDDVDAFGTALVNLGLKGKRIAVISETRYEWVLSYMATVNGTGIIVPLDKELPENEIKSLLIRSKASAIIFSKKKKEQILNIASEIDFVEYYINMDSEEDEGNFLSFHKLLQKGYDLLKNGDTSFTSSEIDNEAMNMLLFTSATTDVSKAVMLSHKNITSNLMAMCSMLYIDDKDVFLSVLPIHHTYECTCGFLCPIYRGATVAFCEGLRHIQKNLQECGATIMLGVPLIFEAMYRRIQEQISKNPKLKRKVKFALKLSNILKKMNIDISRKLFAPIHQNFGGKIRIFISGAAAIDPLVAKGFRDFGIHFVQGYGLTECSPILALNRDVDFKDDAAGLPLPNLEVKIHNPNNEGVGEIIAKGPSVMIGYYENQLANEAAFSDGWFFTGDMGYIDKDNFVHITGRKKNVIVTKNGKNIYPEEIETLLNRSDLIKESLVYGKEGSSDTDLTVSAIIIPDMDKIEELYKDISLSPQKIFELIKDEVKKVNSKLVTYKYVKDIEIRNEEFAKTTTNKIKRYIEKK